MIRRMRSLASRRPAFRARLHICRLVYSSVDSWGRQEVRVEGRSWCTMRRATAQLSVMAASGRHLGLADRATEGERCDGVKCTTADREPERCIRRIHHRNCVLSVNGNIRNRAQQGALTAPCHLPSTAPHCASSAGWPTTTQHSLPPAAIPRHAQVIHADNTAEALN